jgi:hypothetical protein
MAILENNLDEQTVMIRLSSCVYDTISVFQNEIAVHLKGGAKVTHLAQIIEALFPVSSKIFISASSVQN